MRINNIKELKDFIQNSKASLKDKTEITNRCLNIMILGNIVNEVELIELIDKNKNNKDNMIVLGKGINPLNRELIFKEMMKQPEAKKIIDEIESKY